MKENGYEMKRYGYPVKRYCQTMDLKDDPELIAKYRECHSKEKSWREIREGIRSVGILEMEIYICGNRLFMIVETPIEAPRMPVPHVFLYELLHEQVPVSLRLSFLFQPISHDHVYH
jgi:hypothetical protein